MSNLIQSLAPQNLEENSDEVYNWEENTPFLYDVLFVEEIENPLLSIQFQDFEKEDEDFFYYKLIGGSNSFDNCDNYVALYNLKIPKTHKLKDLNEFSCIESVKKFHHEGEINKLKINPFNKNIVASRTNYGTINLYNLFCKDDFISDRPIDMIQFGKDSSFTIDWFENRSGYLATSDNNQFFVFDIENSKNKILEKNFDSNVNYILSDKFSDNIVYIAFENGELGLLDIRDHRFINKIKLNHEIFSFDTTKFLEQQIVTGGTDGNLCLIDLRSDILPLYSFDKHDKDIINVSFSKHRKGIFSSSSDDNVIIWDINEIGTDLEEDDDEEDEGNSHFVTELLFTHNGHDSKLSDFSWSYNYEGLCASSEENENKLHIWKTSKTIIN